MNPDRIKHLEFISNTITRLNGNSFSAKAWCIAITAAILAMNDGHPRKGIFVITTFAAISFWLFDAYYLSLERKFVRMFRDVAASTGPTDFFMDPKAYENDYASWQSAMQSSSMILYWGLILTGVLVSVFSS